MQNPTKLPNMATTKVNDLVLKNKVESFFVRSIKTRNKKGFCITRDKMAAVMDKWSLFVIYNLAYYETLRFGKLKTNISGISSRMLSVTLKKLETHQIVKRKVFAVVPPKVEYSLTEFGKELAEKSLDLNEWLLERHMSSKGK